MNAEAGVVGTSRLGVAAPSRATFAPPVSVSTHVAHIDGLRAIAVLAVITCHLDRTWLPGGFAGVDVFFAISGFVVAASVQRWNQGGLAGFLGYFYARRIQRILPALLACLLVTCLASTLLVPVAWLSDANDRTAIHAFFGLSNWFLAHHRENYFSPAIEFNPYTHTWSLGVEEQFYLLFPFLFFAWTRGGRGRTLSMVLFAAAFAGSLAWAAWLGRTDPTAAYYLIQSRLWELAAGVLLFQLLSCIAIPWQQRNRLRDAVVSAGAWLCFGLLAVALATSTSPAFPWPGALLPVLATLGLVGFLHVSRPGLLARALGSAPMTTIGRLSYSLYLWHWPVFVMLRWTCGLESPGARTAGIVITFALAAASYRWVERPLRYAEFLRRWPRPRVVAAGILMVGAGSALAVQVILARPTIALTTVARDAADWYADLVYRSPDVPGCRLQIRRSTEGSGSLVVLTRAACAASEPAPPSIFAIGDSHTTGYRTLLSEHVLRTGAEVALYDNPGCTFASLQPAREGGRCGVQGQAALDDILARARAGDILLLAALRVTRLSNQYAPTNETAAWESMLGSKALAERRRAENEVLARLRPLAEHGVRIVLEAPKPLLRAPPFRCSDPFNASNPICAPGLTMARDEMERFRQPVLESFSRMAARMAAISIWDPLPVLCPGVECLPSMEGRPLYFDGDHLSAHGNRVLLPSFTQHLASIAGTDVR